MVQSVITDRCHSDSNGNLRFFFGTGGPNVMYLSGGSSSYSLSVAHEFRGGGDQFTLGYMTGLGYMYAYARPTLSERRIMKDIEEINDEEGLRIK